MKNFINFVKHMFSQTKGVVAIFILTMLLLAILFTFIFSFIGIVFHYSSEYHNSIGYHPSLGIFDHIGVDIGIILVIVLTFIRFFSRNEVY